jgi:tRNA threonylcarbamoyladenosine biosynthesis protein TsaE
MEFKKSLKRDEIVLIINEIKANLSDQTIILLDGPLGSGKTYFINQFLSPYINTKIQSPTFSLIHEYEVKDFCKVFHVDLYRIESDMDLDSTGFWDIFENDQALVFLEWSNKIDFSQLPIHWKKIKIEISKPFDDEVRDYKYSVN